MRRIQRLSCGCVGAAQGGTRSCDLRDPRPAPATLVGLRSRGENAWARGRRRYCADERGRVVRRLARGGCVRRVMADERARLVNSCARVGGDAGPASWATRVKGQAGWFARPSRPGLLLLPLLSFLFYLLPIWLGFIINIKLVKHHIRQKNPNHKWY